jgi:hypothetical protein
MEKITEAEPLSVRKGRFPVASTMLTGSVPV